MLLEDLSDTHYLVPASDNPSPYGGWRSFDNLSRQTFEEIVAQAARFQAFWWGHPETNRQDLLQCTGDLPNMADTANPESVDIRLRELSELSDLPSDTIQTAREAIATWPELYAGRVANAAEHLTFMHVDFHLRNVLIPHNPSKGGAVILDWENFTRGIGVSDVAHLLISSMLPPDTRECLEMDLIERYHQILIENGVRVYSLEDCLRDYKLSVIALITQQYRARPFLRACVLAYHSLGCKDLIGG